MSTWMILASGAKAEILPVTRSSKREPEGDEEIGLLHGGDGGVVAVHAGHAQAQGVGVGEGAAAHEGGDDGDPGAGGQLEEGLGPAGLQDPAAGVEDGALGGQDQLGRPADLGRVAGGPGW